MQQPNIVKRYILAGRPWPGESLKYVSFDADGNCFYERADGSIEADYTDDGCQYWTVTMADENVADGIWKKVEVEMPKDKVVTRKFEHFTGEWGAVSQNENLKYVVFINNECYFEYHDGRTVIKPMLQWTLGTAAFAVKAKQWKEVEVEDGNKG